MGTGGKLFAIGLCGLLWGTSNNEEIVRPKNFHVYSTEEHVTIQWLSQAQNEPISYCLQKSGDNKSFQTISCFYDNGSEPDMKEFLETDFNPNPGWSYYRVNTIDENGELVDSKTVPVFYGINRLKKGKIIAPDPLDKTTTQKVELSAFDGNEFLFVLKDSENVESVIKTTLMVEKNQLKLKSDLQSPGTYTIVACTNYAVVGLEVEVIN